MEANKNTVTDETKEAVAILVMRTMLLALAKEENIPFEKALLEFTRSKTYEALFDYETAIWREGPEYLKEWYLEEKKRK